MRFYPERLGTRLTLTDQFDMLTRDSVQTRAHDDSAASGYANAASFLLPFLRPRTELDVPKWGYAGRDPALGRVWKVVGADLVASAIAVMSQKIESTDYTIEGPQRTVAGRCRPLLDNAELGKGWLHFVAKWVQAYCCYDNGVFVELISDAPSLTYGYGAGKQRYIDGDPVPDLMQPRSGPVLGIAVLDSTRCARTRDLDYPVRYYDLQGRSHLIHHTRVYFTSDLPSTEEWLYDYGYCALSRCLSTLLYAVNWSAARNEMLDAMPPLQYLAISGVNKETLLKQMKDYQAERTAMGEYILRSVMLLVSPNSDKPITMQSENIRQLWESFDEQTAFNTSVDMVAMAFGLDHQDLAPLSSSAMGSATQSTVLDEKTRGKGPGHIRAKIEQMLKSIFPASCKFGFDYQDDTQDLQRITIINSKIDAVLKVFNAKQGSATDFGAGGIASGAYAYKAATLPPNGSDTPVTDTLTGTDSAPAEEFLIDRQKGLRLLMHEVPDWAEILDPDGSVTEDVTVDELTPELRTKCIQQYGPKVRYNRKSGQTVYVKARPVVKPVEDWELAEAVRDLAAIGIDVRNVRQYAKASSYDPGQARDGEGQWSETGAGSGIGKFDPKTSEQLSKQAVAKLGKPDKDAVQGYSGVEARIINDNLRGHESFRTLTPKDKKNIDLIDNAINNSPLTEPTTLYRGFALNPASLSKFKPGQTVNDLAFSSTSLDPGVAEKFSGATKKIKGAVVMRISAPKGTKALPMSTLSDWPGEHEVLLPRNTTFKITAVKKKGGVIYVDAAIGA